MLPERKSKSQLKREMTALQETGKILVDLPPAQLAQIPLTIALADAITAMRTMTSHGARRRQLQYIGRLMRTVDSEPIEEALAKLELKSRQGKAQFHQIEHWRDRLIAEDDSVIQEFLTQFPETDRQQLRQLTRNAKKLIKGADTELFRFLRDSFI